jgi:hypothetical protein
MVAAGWILLQRFVRIRPKAPEAKTNLAVIRTLEFAYFEKHGAYVPADPTPAQIATSEALPWPLGPDVEHGFNTLGWRPEGSLRCQYAVAVEGLAFTAAALCPDREEVAAWGFVQPAPGQSRGIPGPFGRCSERGIVLSTGAPLLEVVGPCDETRP